MKKIVFLILALMFLVIPFSVSANSTNIKIDSTTITEVPGLVSAGDEISITFDINFSGLDKNSNVGLVMVMFSLEYDKATLIPIEMTSKNWEPISMVENGITLIGGIISESGSEDIKCSDGILYCTDYSVTVKFFVKDSDKTETVVKMGEIVAGLLDSSNISLELTEEDVIYITGESNVFTSINIKTSEEEITKEPENITENNTKLEDKINDVLPNISNNNSSNNNNNSSNNNSNNVVAKSNNKYLSSLEIEGYNISFYKYIKDYEITVSKDVNTLNIKATTADSKASYKIIGADDLAKNNYKVSIEVTAENKEKYTYTIKVNVEDKEEIVVGDEEKDTKKLDIKIKKEYLIIAGIALGVIFLLVLIIKFIIHAKDRKLEKALDEL